MLVVDGSPSIAGNITHAIDLTLQVNGHTETITCYLTKLGKYELLLGKPWLALHNPVINWKANSVLFNSKHCFSGCIKAHTGPVLVKGITQTKDAKFRRVSAISFDTLSRQHGVEIFSCSLYEINKRIEELTGESVEIPHTSQRHRYDTGKTGHSQMESHLHDEDGDEHNEDPNTRSAYALAASMYLAGASLEDVAIAMRQKLYTDPATKLPKHLHEYLHVFDAQEAEKLPPHRHCDHKIEVKPGTTPPSGPLYNMSVQELRVLRKWLDENLEKGFIRASNSPAACFRESQAVACVSVSIIEALMPSL